MKYKDKLDPKIVQVARMLRKNQTDAEELLWSLLRNRQIANAKFRRQSPIGHYVMDFYCHQHKLCIELDGSQHGTGSNIRHDEERTSYLHSQGIRVLRFWNSSILTETEAVIETIFIALTEPDLVDDDYRYIG